MDTVCCKQIVAKMLSLLCRDESGAYLYANAQRVFLLRNQYVLLFESKDKLLWILRIVIIYAICIIPSFLPLISVLTLEDHGFDRPDLCLDSVSKATCFVEIWSRQMDLVIDYDPRVFFLFHSLYVLVLLVIYQI